MPASTHLLNVSATSGAKRMPLAASSSPIHATALMPRIACVQLYRRESQAGDDEAWLAACYRVTPRLERVSSTCALLDLGNCTDGEAAAVAEHLLHRLAALEGGRTQTLARVRIGIGTSVLCAQLALLTPGSQVGRQLRATRDKAPIRVLTAAEAPAVLRALPIRRLPLLHPAGTVTEEAVARLERYGVRMLGQVARLGEVALRRQFGERVGVALAALAAGRDLRPLLPTLKPATLRCRIAFPSGATPARVLAALEPAAERIARQLAMEGRQTCRLRLALIWQAGGMSAGHVRLRTPIAEAQQIARQVSDLCRTLLLAAPVERADEGDGDPPVVSSTAIEQVMVEGGDLVPLTLAQATFWRTAAQRQTAVSQVAEALARRFGGQPQLVHAWCATPDAIIPNERYRWLPVGPPGPAGQDRLPARSRISQTHRDGEMGTRPPWEQVPHHLHWW